MVASSFGKLVMKENPREGVKEEDLAIALLMMITNNIGQVRLLGSFLAVVLPLFSPLVGLLSSPLSLSHHTTPHHMCRSPLACPTTIVQVAYLPFTSAPSCLFLPPSPHSPRRLPLPVQVAYLNAQLHGCTKIFFVGSFLRHNPISCRRLAYAINFWSKGACVRARTGAA